MSRPPPSREAATGKKARASTTGGAGPRNVDMSGWRKKLQDTRIKFDDDAKAIFLRVFATTGRVTDACDASHITFGTYRSHLKNDLEFAEAFLEAKERYKDRVHEQADMLMYKGVKRPVIGRVGENQDGIIAYEKKYSESLLAMELRRTNPEYREKEPGMPTHELPRVLVVPERLPMDRWMEVYGKPALDAMEQVPVTTEGPRLADPRTLPKPPVRR